MKNTTIEIYTDGSCHTQALVGAWAAIIFIDDEKIILKGVEQETTHNRMELLAVTEAINHLDQKLLFNEKLLIHSDSQYVVNLQQRKDKLKARNFITNKGTPIQNEDLVTRLIKQIESHNLEFVKIKAHQKNGNVWNREVDFLVRKLVREKINAHGREPIK